MLAELRRLFVDELVKRDMDEAGMFQALALLDAAMATFAGQVDLTPLVVYPGQPRVYYLRREDGAIKIGYSVDVTSRRRQLETAHGVLDLLAWEPGGFDVEQQRHRDFGPTRLSQGSEWFAPSPYLLTHIAFLAESLRGCAPTLEPAPKLDPSAEFGQARC